MVRCCAGPVFRLLYYGSLIVAMMLVVACSPHRPAPSSVKIVQASSPPLMSEKVREAHRTIESRLTISEYEEALAATNALLQSEMNGYERGRTLYYRAQAYAGMGQPKQAIASLEKLLAQPDLPEDTPAGYNLKRSKDGWVRFALGRLGVKTLFQQIVESLERGTQLPLGVQPDVAEKLQIADAAIGRGEGEAASKILNAALFEKLSVAEEFVFGWLRRRVQRVRCHWTEEEIAAYRPMTEVEIRYPHHHGRLEGYVVLEFTVTELGTVEDPVVMEANPRGYFERAAIRAMMKFKFIPKTCNGEPEPVPGVRYRFEIKRGGN